MQTDTGNNTGAIVTKQDPSIAQYADVAGDSLPFDRIAGYDVCNELKLATGLSDVPTKDQDGSLSCGGQACAYDEEVDMAITLKKFVEKSAKYIYAPIHAPGGGSTQQALMSRIMQNGVADEVVCPSYSQGSAPDEAFMTNVADITKEADLNALASIGWKPVYVNMYSFDEMAKAIRDWHGIVIGILGQNNNTWRSADPVAPNTSPYDAGLWAHWLYFGKALMRSGMFKLGCKNSWGNVGENGWQYLNETYKNYFFSAFTLVYMGVPHFKHTFTVPMKYGDHGDEVQALQNALKIDGTFPVGQALTKYFGRITEKAVKAFQQKYASEILTPVGLKVPTGYCGVSTMKKLNQLFS